MNSARAIIAAILAYGPSFEIKYIASTQALLDLKLPSYGGMLWIKKLMKV